MTSLLRSENKAQCILVAISLLLYLLAMVIIVGLCWGFYSNIKGISSMGQIRLMHRKPYLFWNISTGQISISVQKTIYILKAYVFFYAMTLAIYLVMTWYNSISKYGRWLKLQKIWYLSNLMEKCIMQIEELVGFSFMSFCFRNKQFIWG